MREIVHMQAGQCGNQIGAKVTTEFTIFCCKIAIFRRYESWRLGVYLLCRLDLKSPTHFVSRKALRISLPNLDKTYKEL